LHHTRLTNFKRAFELCLGCEEHGEFFEFLKLQFSFGEFKGKTLRWMFCLFNEVLTDTVVFCDHLAEELRDQGVTHLIKPAIAQKLKDVLKCLDCVASQEQNRRMIMEKYGKQARLLGGKPFCEFYDLYEEFCGEKYVFGRIVKEVELRKAKYSIAADEKLLDYSKVQNEYLLSEMKEQQREEDKGKGPAIEEMEDEEDDHWDEPSSKRSKLSEREEEGESSSSMDTGDS
jgi:hypothetical protein